MSIWQVSKINAKGSSNCRSCKNSPISFSLIEKSTILQIERISSRWKDATICISPLVAVGSWIFGEFSFYNFFPCSTLIIISLILVLCHSCLIPIICREWFNKMVKSSQICLNLWSCPRSYQPPSSSCLICLVSKPSSISCGVCSQRLSLN